VIFWSRLFVGVQYRTLFFVFCVFWVSPPTPPTRFLVFRSIRGKSFLRAPPVVMVRGGAWLNRPHGVCCFFFYFFCLAKVTFEKQHKTKTRHNRLLAILRCPTEDLGQPPGTLEFGHPPPKCFDGGFFFFLFSSPPPGTKPFCFLWPRPPPWVLLFFTPTQCLGCIWLSKNTTPHRSKPTRFALYTEFCRWGSYPHFLGVFFFPTTPSELG